MLKDFFEEQLTASVSDNGNVVIGNLEYPPSEILKQQDETAYNDVYQAWLDEIWIPTQKEILKNIWRIDQDNQPRFRSLCEAFNRNQVVPFVGSGMSCPSGLPTWRELLELLRTKTHVSKDELDVILNRGEYEKAFDLLAVSRGMNKRLLCDQIQNKLTTNLESISGAIRLFPDIFKETIITTNLDDVLEQLYLGDQSFVHVLIGDSIESYREHRGGTKKILLKLHGHFNDSKNHVLGSDEYNRVYCAGSGFRTNLELICQSNHLLFTGCSLNIDRTVNLLADVATRDSNMPKHDAFIATPIDNTIKIAREHELTARGIFPIWYNDNHDESLNALLTGMIYQQGIL